MTVIYIAEAHMRARCRETRFQCCLLFGGFVFDRDVIRAYPITFLSKSELGYYAKEFSSIRVPIFLLQDIK